MAAVFGLACFASGVTLEAENFLFSAKLTPSGYAGTSTLTNFPMLVDFARLRRTSLPELAPGQYAADGSDVRFADAAGNVLDCEVDHADTGAGDLALWVKVPRFAATNAVTMVWGVKPGKSVPAVTPTAVWADYHFVLHMEAASGAVADATGNGYAATPSDAIAETSVATNFARVGNARAQQGGNYTIPTGGTLAHGATFTASGWFYSSSTLTYFNNLSGTTGFKSYSDIPDSRYWRDFQCAGKTSQNKWLSRGENKWLYMVFVYDGATGTLYNKRHNISQTSTSLTPVADSALDLVLASGIHGASDELRLCKSAQSADWIGADFQQVDVEGFLRGTLVTRPPLALEPVGPCAYRGGAAVTPTVVVRDGVTDRMLAAGTDYTVSYADNAAKGLAKVILTGKSAEYAGVVVTNGFTIADAWCVAPDVTDEGTGADWSSPLSLTNAVKTCPNGALLLVKAGRYALGSSPVATDRAFFVRGGCAGTAGSYDMPAATDAVSVFDGEHQATDVIKTTAAAAAGVTEFRNCAFVNGYSSGSVGTAFTKSGSGSLYFRHCRFAGSTHTGRGCGRGGTFSGNACATLGFYDCAFEGNVNSGGNDGYQSGDFAASIATFGRVDLFDVRAVTNGIPWTGGGGGRYQSGASAFNVSGAPVHARRCRFVGNKATGGADGGTGGAGGVFRLSGASGGSIFENCVFASNREVVNGWGTYLSGQLIINLSATNQTVAITNCTFAYNKGTGASATASLRSSCGITLQKGAATAVGTIFHKNASATAGTGCDVHVSGAGSSFTARYCRFDAIGDANQTAASGAILDIDAETCLTGDPRFVTTYDDVVTALGKSDEPSRHLLTSVDLHLRSTAGSCRNATGAAQWYGDDENSPAVDAGDPASEYRAEPHPNGSRVNLGAYGNTDEASKSYNEIERGGVKATFAVTTIRFVYTGEPIRPAVVVTDSYTGQALPASEYEVVYSDNVNPGTARITVNGRGDHHGSAYLTFTILNGWHVTAYSLDEEGDGSSWDSPVSLTNAFAQAQPGEVILVKAGTYTLAAPLVVATTVEVRGGRKGTSGSGDDELDATNPESVFDAHRALVDVVRLTAPYDANVATFSRCAFVNALKSTYSDYANGVNKSGTCSARFERCRFANNHCTARYAGRGGTFTGSSSATLAFSDCVFAGNGSSASCDYDLSGLGAYVSGFKAATFENCAFLTNLCVTGIGRDAWGSGSALCVSGVPTTIRGCTFFGNTGYGSERNYTGSSGGIVYLGGACGGSVVANCAFAGNRESARVATVNAGALVANLASDADTLTVENCTFACNRAGNTTAGSAGLHVKKGTVTVINSIFHDNVVTGSKGSDIYVAGTATCTVSRTIFDDRTDALQFAADTATLAFDTVTCVTGDPMLVSATYPKTVTLPALCAFDLHIKGRLGYLDEKTGLVVRWRGCRPISITLGLRNNKTVNLGYYGGTPYETRLPVPGFALILR